MLTGIEFLNLTFSLFLSLIVFYDSANSHNLRVNPYLDRVFLYSCFQESHTVVELFLTTTSTTICVLQYYSEQYSILNEKHIDS